MPVVDRDTALATLISLLDPAAFPAEDYTDALEQVAWDVERAAEILLLPAEERRRKPQGIVDGRPTKKAKSQSGLHGWLKGSAKTTDALASTSTRQDPDLVVSPHVPDVAGPSTPTKRSDPSSPSPAKMISPIKNASPSPQLDRVASAANWAALLKPTAPLPPPPTAPKRAPPLHLASAEAIKASKLPLALLPSPLSASQAGALYHEMMAQSPSWPRNKFFLNGKEVESNHQATGYCRPDEGVETSNRTSYYYAARREEPKPYPPLLAQAATLVENLVNDYLADKPRYPSEYRGRWRANMCAANRYDGAGATVGFHSDQMTYLGPYPTIASLSLGTPRNFRLRPVPPKDAAFANTEQALRTYEVQLGHNCLCLMTPGCQERFKHTIPPQRALDVFRAAFDASGLPIPPEDQVPTTSRINITFRFYRDDFHPTPAPSLPVPREGTPVCKCGIPTLLRADQKAKARARLGATRATSLSYRNIDGVEVVSDDMVHFWQCQSPALTGAAEGCGFFRILDMKAEGRGPCVGDAPRAGAGVGSENDPAGEDPDVEAPRMAMIEARTKRPELDTLKANVVETIGKPEGTGGGQSPAP